ncbi:hypothetical protein ACFY4C_05690 [Actinomadura viridis]|uniref:hypothetical protein n=1 Tax=Actinomadura viridis TaxID=58110 RepID=UPI0036C92128
MTRRAPLPARERAAFRAWVRAHHPDAGGDPEAFAEGLCRARPSRPVRRSAAVTLVRRRRGPAGLLIRWRERRLRARRLR